MRIRNFHANTLISIHMHLLNSLPRGNLVNGLPRAASWWPRLLSILHQLIASMLYKELIFKHDDVSWYEVEIQIVTGPNEWRDAEMLRLPWWKLENTFDHMQTVDVHHRNYCWSVSPTLRSYLKLRPWADYFFKKIRFFLTNTSDMKKLTMI